MFACVFKHVSNLIRADPSKHELSRRSFCAHSALIWRAFSAHSAFLLRSFCIHSAFIRRSFGIQSPFIQSPFGHHSEFIILNISNHRAKPMLDPGAPLARPHTHIAGSNFAGACPFSCSFVMCCRMVCFDLDWVSLFQSLQE